MGDIATRRLHEVAIESAAPVQPTAACAVYIGQFSPVTSESWNRSINYICIQHNTPLTALPPPPHFRYFVLYGLSLPVYAHLIQTVVWNDQPLLNSFYSKGIELTEWPTVSTASHYVFAAFVSVSFLLHTHKKLMLTILAIWTFLHHIVVELSWNYPSPITLFTIYSELSCSNMRPERNIFL